MAGLLATTPAPPDRHQVICSPLALLASCASCLSESAWYSACGSDGEDMSAAAWSTRTRSRGWSCRIASSNSMILADRWSTEDGQLERELLSARPKLVLVPLGHQNQQRHVERGKRRQALQFREGEPVERLVPARHQRQVGTDPDHRRRR